MLRTALLPGSFNPPTLGHLDLIKRASSLFNHLYVGIAQNSQKQPALFSIDERMEMLKIICEGINNIEIITFEHLVADVIEQRKIDVIIRGLRTSADLAFEMQLAAANKQMTHIDTLFLLAEGRYSHLSSTLIREIGSNGRRLCGFVPDIIEENIFQKLFVLHK